MNSVTKDEVRTKIIEAVMDKRGETKEQAEQIADMILAQPSINENTYEIFLKNAKLLESTNDRPIN